MEGMTEDTDQELTESPKSEQTFYVVFAALVASIGGVLFGYDIGIVSGALLQLKGIFSLSAFQQELVVSGVLIGAFCASFVGGNMVDSWGRKTGIVISCGLFILGSLILFLSVNFIMLVIGRFVVGMAVSISVTAECTYISEISPPSRRGMMVSFNEVGITTGFLLAYCMNYLFISVPNGWKYMFGVAAIPAIIQTLGVALMPNSHHYLLVKGKIDEARKVLSRLRNNDEIDDEIEAIITSIDEQKNRRYVDLFSSESNMRGRMILGMALVFLQQFSGNANVLYYAPTVFQHFGYSSDTAATLVSVGLGIVKVLATTITLLIVDKVGRRSLLLTGTLLMATSIIILGIVGTVDESQSIPQPQTATSQNLLSDRNYTDDFKLQINQNLSVIRESEHKNSANGQNDSFDTEDHRYMNETLNTTVSNTDLHLFDLIISRTNSSKEKYEILASTTEPVRVVQIMNETSFSVKSDNRTTFVDLSGVLQNATNNATKTVPFSTKIISVVSLMTFVCAYSISYGPVTWLVLSEIFPGSLRGRAVSVATCMNWGSNIIVSLTFLDTLNAVGIGPTFVTYGFICYGAAIFVFFCVPETKNRTLEEINDVLSKGMLRKDWKRGFARAHRKYSMRNRSFSMEKTNYNSMQERKNTNKVNDNS